MICWASVKLQPASLLPPTLAAGSSAPKLPNLKQAPLVSSPEAMPASCKKFALASNDCNATE